MQKGMKFKVLPPKGDGGILSILSALRVHPQVTLDTLENPTNEKVAAMLQQLSVEIAHDMDVLQVKAVMPPNIPFPEIYDEAKEGLMTMKFAQQLAFVNGIDDFSSQDIWQPDAKRLRVMLSGIINFIRYKDKQQSLMTRWKEELYTLQHQRAELERNSTKLDDDLQEAHATHNDELPLLFECEKTAQEAVANLEKTHKDVRNGEMVLDEVQKRANEWQGRIEQRRRDAGRIRDEVKELQGRIADSPEDLQQRISDLRVRIPQMRDVNEEKHHEKREAVQRVQALTRLKASTGEYLDKLREVLADQVNLDELRQRLQGENVELTALRERNDRSRAQLAQQEQHKEQITSGIELDRQQHTERMRQWDERRQSANLERQEQQTRLTEEQRRQHAQQTERLELESQLAEARRVHQAELVKIQDRRKEVLEDLVDFNRFAEKELATSSVLGDLVPARA